MFRVCSQILGFRISLRVWFMVLGLGSSIRLKVRFLGFRLTFRYNFRSWIQSLSL